MPTEQLNDHILARGQAIFADIKDQTPSLFDRERWIGRVMDWCMRHESFRVQLFRFVDVVPALPDGKALTRHLQEYFGSAEQIPEIFRLGARHASLGGTLGADLLGRLLRGNIRDLARQFIIGETAEEALRNLLRLRGDGFAAVLDLLGEATVTTAEAEQYVASYLELLDALAVAQPDWPPLTGPKADNRDWGDAPRINVAVKPTACCPRIHAEDFEGAVMTICERLERIYRKVIEVDGFLCIDMEAYHTKEITLEVYRRLRSRFPEQARLGLALQAYLRDTDTDLEQLLTWARRENLPIAIRLVKGAYWDSETVLAAQHGWAVPVYTQKAETDAAFERQARRILEDHTICHLACGSHNIRSIAAVLETARELNVPEERYEFQVLYGMAEPIRQALLQQAGRVRLYAPYGELLPGMAYLVRRLLENTANQSFLRQSFAEQVDNARLLTDPRSLIKTQPAPPEPTGFRNEPTVDFSRATTRKAFTDALATVRGQLGRDWLLHIGGQELATVERLPSTNPADPDEVVGWVAQAGPEQLEQAMSAAQQAYPAWRATPAETRAAMLEKAAELARQRRLELAAWQLLEIGKQWDQACADVNEAIDFLVYYAREMRRLAVPQTIGRVPGEANIGLFEPLGVTAVIAPWNFPLAISCGMVAAALVTGNCVIYKPSNLTAVTGRLLVDLLLKAGLPEGVLNFVPGPGTAIGDLLVEHPAISLVAFTGSCETGLRIVEKAARVQPGQTQVKRVIAEMGGKNAIIIDDDADLDEAIPQILAATFGFSGQKCSACSRLIVLDAVYDRLVPRLVEAAAALRIGPAEDPANDLGPVADAAQQKKILDYIDLGEQEGTLLYQSDQPNGGHYVPATLIGDITPEHRIAREEIFGPVLAIMRVKDFDQAIAWANTTPFALTGAVFSRSPAHLDQARREFRVGNLYLNRNCVGALVGRQPFGGAQLSGLGTKAGGPDYLAHFMDQRVVTENTMRRGFAPETTTAELMDEEGAEGGAA